MNNYNLTTEQLKYQEASKRVKKIKGFYTFLITYIIVNLMLLIPKYQSLDADVDFWRLRTFSITILWGIGLVVYGLSIFLPSYMTGKDWEERKIKEFMDQEKNNKYE